MDSKQMNEFEEEIVDVYNTDKATSIKGIVLYKDAQKMRIEIDGSVTLLFNRIKPNVFVANMAGMEFVVDVR